MTDAIRAHRSAAIDGLRAVAALSVVGYHSWQYSRADATAYLPAAGAPVGDAILHELRLGLVLFFVLSGFLLFTPWVRAALDGADRPRVRAYFVRRAARILPAYYVAVLGSIAILWGLDRATPGLRLPDTGHLWLFGVFGQNFHSNTLLKLNPPLWTLAVEVSFYVVLPVFGWLTLRLPRANVRWVQLTVPALFVVAGLLWNNAIAHTGGSLSLTKILPATAPYFGAGMAAAVLAHGRHLRPRATAGLFALGVLVVLVDGSRGWTGDLTGLGSLDPVVVRDLPSSIGFAAIIAAAATATRRVPVLSARPLALVGLVSYGLYLWHVPLLVWLRGHDLLPGSAALAFAVVIGPALAIATLSWVVLERPAQAWAQRVTRRVRTPPDGRGPNELGRRDRGGSPPTPRTTGT